MHTSSSLAGGVVLTACALVCSAGSAGAAAAPTRVALPVCANAEFGGNGVQDVAAGPVVAALGGWAVGPRGALVHWLKSQTTTISVTDDAGVTTVLDRTTEWGAPQRLDPKVWGSQHPDLDLGVLAPGESVLVEFATTWTKPTMENFHDGSGPLLSQGGETSGTCLITAE